MLVSAREATRVLGSVGIDREATRRVLRAGLAGVAVVVGRTHLYEVDALNALAGRPVMARRGAPEVFLARVATRPDFNVASSFEEQAAALATGWRAHHAESLALELDLANFGQRCFVATVGSFVAFGADITAAHGGGARARGRPSELRLQLAPPGDWFAEFEGRRIVTGPGHAWLWWPHGGRTATGATTSTWRDMLRSGGWLQQCRA